MMKRLKDIDKGTTIVFAVFRKGERDEGTYRDVWARKIGPNLITLDIVAHIKRSEVKRVNDAIFSGRWEHPMTVTVDPELIVGLVGQDRVYYEASLKPESYVGTYFELFGGEHVS